MLEDIYKIYKHNPPHLFRPQGKYFITGAISKKSSLLRYDEAKKRVLNSFEIACNKYDWILEDWVILDNHYHIMLNAPDNAINLSKLIQEVHKFTALWLKKNIKECVEYLHIFENYWDTCLTYQGSYCARLNYIYFNSVKHGYVDSPEKYRFGSYFYRIQAEENDLEELKKNYPFDELNIQDNF